GPRVCRTPGPLALPPSPLRVGPPQLDARAPGTRLGDPPARAGFALRRYGEGRRAGRRAGHAQPRSGSSGAAFTALCGVAPLPASSGQTTRHRLNRRRHLRANAAPSRVVTVRMRASAREDDKRAVEDMAAAPVAAKMPSAPRTRHGRFWVAEADGRASLTVVWSATYSGWRSWWMRSALPRSHRN